MGGCFSRLFHYYFPRSKLVLVLGQQGAGKTSILSLITPIDKKVEDVVIPPQGVMLEQVDYEDDIQIQSWDHNPNWFNKNLQNMFYQDASAIVYVIDSSNTDYEKFEEVRVQFWEIIKQLNNAKIPLLVIAGKQDLQVKLDREEIYKSLGLEKLEKDRPFKYIGSTIDKPKEIIEAFKWVMRQIKDNNHIVVPNQ
eukprot:403372407